MRELSDKISIKTLRAIVYGNKFLSALNQLRIDFIRCFRIEWPTVIRLRLRYRRQLRRIRAEYGRRKLRVIFPVSNVSKWKEQSLYDRMKQSDQYDPLVALTVMDIENDLSDRDKSEQIVKNIKFFDARGCDTVVAYSVGEKRAIPFREFHADIVWYTQPWRIAPAQDCLETAKTALCCYTPYYLQNHGCLDMECGILFMRSVWRNFAMNGAWANVCERYQGWRRAGKSVGLGHTMIDEFQDALGSVRERKHIIYAPHWSCDINMCLSTFLQNGKKILELAKRHPELHWVFKPHPALRSVLLHPIGWTLDEVNAYYAEWESLGATCYNGNYVDLFQSSKGMITDCGSFLVEYACTGNPIIHLVSSKTTCVTHPISRELFNTYYQAHDWDEFMRHFNRVVLEDDDFKKSERLEVVRRMKLLGTDAARNIMNYLDEMFNAKRR